MAETAVERHRVSIALACRAFGLRETCYRYNPKLKNETLFSSLAQARTEIKAWKDDYNKNRPHSSLGNVTPNEFAIKMALEKQAA